MKEGARRVGCAGWGKRGHMEVCSGFPVSAGAKTASAICALHSSWLCDRRKVSEIILITGFAFALAFQHLGQVAVYFLDSSYSYLQPLVCKLVIAEVIRCIVLC